MFWLARLYLSIPLPPNYRQIFDEETQLDHYVNLGTFDALKLKPCYFYIRQLIKEGTAQLRQVH